MRPCQPGFSLVELLATVAVMTVLLAIALPSMSELAEQQRASTVANRVLGLLHAGRMQAISRSRTVQVCPARDGLDCSGAADWSEGMAVRIQPRTGRPSSPVLASMQPADLRGLRLVASRGRTPVSFKRDGRATGTNQTLTLCSRDGRALRELIVSNTGRGRVRTPGPNARCPIRAN